MSNLTWRALVPDDLTALVALERFSRDTDGGLASMFEPEAVSERYGLHQQAVTVGAFDAGGQLGGAAAVYPDGADPLGRVTMALQVRPDLRQTDLIEALLRWADKTAGETTAASEGNAVVRLRTESLTDDWDRIYRSAGFEPIEESLVMRRDLRDLVTDLHDPPLVPRLELHTWSSASAPLFASAYAPAFSDRPGFPGWTQIQWIEHVTANDLVPDWSLVATIDRRAVGYVIACTDSSTDPPGGYIWQVGVVASERGNGCGPRLMVASMKRMKAAGARSVHLTVHTDNPRAIHVYGRLGFAVVGRRAIYGRLLRQGI